MHFAARLKVNAHCRKVYEPLYQLYNINGNGRPNDKW